MYSHSRSHHQWLDFTEEVHYSKYNKTFKTTCTCTFTSSDTNIVWLAAAAFIGLHNCWSDLVLLVAIVVKSSSLRWEHAAYRFDNRVGIIESSLFDQLHCTILHLCLSMRVYHELAWLTSVGALAPSQQSVRRTYLKTRCNPASKYGKIRSVRAQEVGVLLPTFLDPVINDPNLQTRRNCQYTGHQRIPWLVIAVCPCTYMTSIATQMSSHLLSELPATITRFWLGGSSRELCTRWISWQLQSRVKLCQCNIVCNTMHRTRTLNLNAALYT